MNIYQSNTYRKDLSWLNFVNEPKGSRETASEGPTVLHMQRWNEDKCRCECKELIDKGKCDKGFIWNPSSCVCECDKSCDVGEYLYYENCECRKKLVDKIVEECTENTEEKKIAKKYLAQDQNKHKNKCSSCTLYPFLFSIIFTINIGIGTYFV